MTENTNTAITHMQLYKNDFNILNLIHITRGLIIRVWTVWFNLKIFLNFLNFFELVIVKLELEWNPGVVFYKILICDDIVALLSEEIRLLSLDENQVCTYLIKNL